MSTKSSQDTNISLKYSNPSVLHSVSEANAKRILTLLKTGEEKITRMFNQDLVVTLGDTGSGKTTFTQFMASDNYRLVSTEVGEHTGEFIISDLDDKISTKSTIISKTVFPELVIDTETKIAWVDNPGFNNSRNEAYDIAAAYFVRKVFDTANNIKIVLVTSYPSVRKGVSQNNFLQLLEHTAVLLKNIDDYADCMTLVATKVDNVCIMREGIPVLMPDSAVIEGIANFLIEVKDSLEVMLNSNEPRIFESKRVENRVFCENAIKILNALLTKEDSRYTRLGVFRRPNEPGKVSEISSLLQCKNSLKTMLQHIPYLPVVKTDIGYTLSDKSKYIIRDLIAEVNDNINTDVAFINVDLINHFRNLERDMLNYDLHTLRNRLKSASKALSNIVSIDKSATVADFLERLSQNFDILGVNVSKSHLRDIAKLGEFLGFLQTINAKKYDSSAWKWIKELDPVVRYIDNALKWCTFLIALYDRLSQYVVQKNKTSYHIPTFDAIGDQTLLVEDLNEIPTFLRAIGEPSILETVYYEEIKRVQVDDVKLRFFDQILQATLNDTLVYESFYEGRCVRVTGEYVLLSQVSDNPSCKGSKSAQIFAKHTVFVDVDLSKTDDITIIAPRWEILGERTVSLNGLDAPSHNCRANAGQNPGEKGEDGMPGLPGQTAGRFMGIGREFKNIENLRIIANGGRGGPGQHGGNGAVGKNGQTFILDRYFSCVNTCKFSLKYTETIFEKPGGHGGDGGCGGIGGLGGHPGKLIAIDTSNNESFSNASKVLNEGECGMDGESGNPGQGGKGGVKFERRVYKNHNRTKTCFKYFIGKAASGKSGYRKGHVFEEGRLLPHQREFLFAPSLILSHYRKELLKNTIDCIKNPTSLLFYQEILRNPQLDEYYDIDVLSLELQYLEECSYRLTLHIASTLYTCVLEKILQIAQSQPNQSNHLKSLHLAIGCKLVRLQARPNVNTSLELQINASSKSQHPPFTAFLSNAIDSLIENHIDTVIERNDAKIIESLSYSTLRIVDDLQELGDLLLERKSFSNMKKFTQFLHLLSVLADVYFESIKKVQITEILPSIKYRKNEIPEALMNTLKNAMYKFRLDIVVATDALRLLINRERESYQTSAKCNIEVVKNLLEIERSLQSTLYTSVKESSLPEIIENFVKFTQKLYSIEKYENKINPSFDEIETMKRIETRRKLIEFDPQFYNKVNSLSNIELLIEALDDAKDISNEHQSCYCNIEALMAQILKTVRTNVTGSYDCDQMMATKTMVLDFIDSVTSYLICITKEFSKKRELPIVQSLLEIVKILRNVFEIIAGVELRTRLHAHCDWVSENNSSDTIIEFIRRDCELYEYHYLVDAFKRSYFPFNVLQSKTSLVPPLFPLRHDEQLHEMLRKSVENNANSWKITLDNLPKSSLNEYIREENFDATSDERSLVQWNYSSYAENITQLLLGRQIVLTASVDPNDHRQYLRFDSIGLRFRALDCLTQPLLSEVLCKFDVRMVHSGRSSHVFCHQVFTLDDESYAYQHAYNVESQTEHSRSPYTVWLLSLHAAKHNVTFNDLRPFIGQPIDLQLKGRAKYFKIENEAATRRTLEIGSMDSRYLKMMNHQIVNEQFVEKENDQPHSSKDFIHTSQSSADN